MKEFKIEKAGENNIEGIFEFHKLLNISEDIDKEKIIKSYNQNLVWICLDNKDKVIGYVLVELFDDKHEQLPNSIFISELYVEEKYRKEGIGKKLVEQVLGTSFDKEYTYFSLSHDPDKDYLTDFYKSLGFVKTGLTKGRNIKMIKEV